MLRTSDRVGVSVTSTQLKFRAAYLLIPLLLVAYFSIAVRQPFGDYDATWWNMKALVIAEGHPLDAFANSALPHLSYPPLQPVIIGMLWRAFGVSQSVVIFYHAFVYMGVLVVLSRLRWWAYLIAGVAILPYATMQYADLSIALAFLFAWTAYRRYGDHALVGAVMGVGLLIKNEAIMLTGIMLVTIALDTRRLPLRVLLGLLPGALALVIFKTIIATAPNDLVGSAGMIERALDGTRYRLILASAANQLLYWGYGAIVFLCLLSRLDRTRYDRAALLWVAIAALGYILIYGITPHDLAWHLRTSIDRLVLHLFPMIAFALAAR